MIFSFNWHIIARLVVDIQGKCTSRTFAVLSLFEKFYICDILNNIKYFGKLKKGRVNKRPLFAME